LKRRSKPIVEDGFALIALEALDVVVDLVRGAVRAEDQPLGPDHLEDVVDERREVDAVFSTYRDDSTISRLGRGELTPADCPADVREVLALGREAERQSDGAFSIFLPSKGGARRLDAPPCDETDGRRRPGQGTARSARAGAMTLGMGDQSLVSNESRNRIRGLARPIALAVMPSPWAIS